MNRAELIDKLKKLKPGESCCLSRNDLYNTAVVKDVLQVVQRSWDVTRRPSGDLEIKRDENCKGGEDGNRDC